MRLLNTNTLTVEEPRGKGKHKYAILSHVWGEEEVSFDDISKPHAMDLKGYAKIEHCCAQALSDGYDYVWVDTCCIDKSSSAELSEAINSMYRWYGEAEVCYAYLEDVRSDEDPATELSQFRRSKWFTRGWTVQELIAPRKLVFFAGDWIKIGTKYSLIPVVAMITGVDERVLSATLPLTEVCVAKKMSWASQRQTTRVEDRAYSLMGIFGVHMPLIYGEGENAFTRLQHEIMTMSNDQSIFAWVSDGHWSLESALLASSPDARNSELSLLATSPTDFQHSTMVNRILPDDFVRLFASTFQDTDYKSHFFMTNSGVQISMPIKSTSFGYTAALACSNNGCLIGLNLHYGGGLFQKISFHHVSAPGPDEKFAIRDMIISTTPSRERHLLSWSAPTSLPGFVGSVRVQTTRVIQEGYVLHKHSLGSQPLRQKDGSFTWEPATSNMKCVLAYHNRVGGEGFVVTIGGWSSAPCVHLHVFADIDVMGRVLPSYYRSAPCCKSHPDWAFKPLRAGKRVTVACQQEDLNSSSFTVTISVDLPQCAEVRR